MRLALLAFVLLLCFCLRGLFCMIWSKQASINMVRQCPAVLTHDPTPWLDLVPDELLVHIIVSVNSINPSLPCSLYRVNRRFQRLLLHLLRQPNQPLYLNPFIANLFLHSLFLNATSRNLIHWLPRLIKANFQGPLALIPTVPCRYEEIHTLELLTKDVEEQHYFWSLYNVSARSFSQTTPALLLQMFPSLNSHALDGNDLAVTLAELIHRRPLWPYDPLKTHWYALWFKYKIINFFAVLFILYLSFCIFLDIMHQMKLEDPEPLTLDEFALLDLPCISYILALAINFVINALRVASKWNVMFSWEYCFVNTAICIIVAVLTFWSLRYCFMAILYVKSNILHQLSFFETLYLGATFFLGPWCFRVGASILLLYPLYRWAFEPHDIPARRRIFKIAFLGFLSEFALALLCTWTVS